MKGRRLLHTIGLMLIPSATKRAEYFRKKRIFAAMGEHCSIMRRNVPLNPELIRIGNNVHMASNVGLITHDITHIMLNNCAISEKEKILENKGCIAIGDNVFIGAGTRILPNTRVGSNVIIGAGSIVNKDIPDNCVAAGCPAKVIGTFDAYVARRRLYTDLERKRNPQRKTELFWKEFENERKQDLS